MIFIRCSTIPHTLLMSNVPLSLSMSLRSIRSSGVARIHRHSLYVGARPLPIVAASSLHTPTMDDASLVGGDR